MIFLIFILIQQISSCTYSCDSCDETNSQCSVCNSQRQLVQLLADTTSQQTQTCQCKDNYIDVGGNQCLQCASNCVKCKQSQPSYCTDCGDVTKTHRILDENNKCVCDTGYQNVWYTYECQSQQFDYQILQFQYILQQNQYIQRLQQRYNYTQDTVNGIKFMISKGVVNDSIHYYQYLNTIQQNQILALNSPYPQGQYYAQQFDNLYTLGIKLNLEQEVYWVANVLYDKYLFFKTSRILYHQWSVGIYQFKLKNYINQIFLQIAISENKNVGSQNRLLSEQTGNMTLFYYLGYNLDRFLFDSELNEIVNDILFIMIEKNDYIDKYSFDGSQIVIDSCIQNYEINGQDCGCSIENGFYFYQTVCYETCPSECITCTKQVCIVDDNTKHCRDGYFQDDSIDIFQCYDCKNECLTCTSLDQCVKCKSQHINVDGKCITCQEYSINISNCKSFNEQCLCTDCYIGYQLISDNTCFSCPETCVSCKFQDKCIICKDGYFLDNFQCKKCQNHCLQCSQYNLCTSIQYGYYFDNGLVNQCQNTCHTYKENCLCVDCPQYFYLSNETYMCNTCVYPCLECSDVDICIDCISDEYYFDKGKCNKCESPCKTCKSKNTCITCISDEFYFDDKQEYCFNCTSPCQTCEYTSQQQHCKTCIQKHYLFLFQCLECPSYCIDDCYFDDINNFVQCKGCVSEYYQTQEVIPFQCLQCPNNCLTCQSKEICLTCAPGSILINNQCVKCTSLYSEYCTECDENTCKTCLKEYEIKDKICKQIVVIVIPTCNEFTEFYNAITNTCDKCILNCNKCQNSQFCIICIDGYFQDQGTCTKCLIPCQNCKSLNYCMSLQNQNYYIDTSKTDIQTINYDKCQSPCKTCLSLTDCLDCVDSYYKDNLKCIKCDQNCLTCSTSSQTCTSCPPGYKLQDNICLKCLDEKCQECFDQCIQCNHLEIEFYKCFVCLPGYVLIDNQCVKCDDSCKTCQDLTTSCTSCPKGYYLTKEMTCEKCDNGCNDCQVQTKSCITCQTGLQLVTEDKIFNYCVQCPISCKQCMSATKCSICEDKTFLNENQQCEKCVSPCLTCTNKDQCLTCVEGYFLKDGKCVKCTGNCLSCTSETDCAICPKQYYLNNNACESCPSGCSSCIDLTTCTACNSGYYLNGICIQCGEHCTKCTNEKCELCESGYELSSDGKLCTKKQVQCTIENCSQCNEDKTKCISCNANYQLDQQGLKCSIQSQNEVAQTPQQEDSGGSSLVFVAAAAGGSILILAFLIWKFNLHKICKLRIKIRRFDNEKEEYPQLPITDSLGCQ